MRKEKKEGGESEEVCNDEFKQRNSGWKTNTFQKRLRTISRVEKEEGKKKKKRQNSFFFFWGGGGGINETYPF